MGSEDMPAVQEKCLHPTANEKHEVFSQNLIAQPPGDTS